MLDINDSFASSIVGSTVVAVQYMIHEINGTCNEVLAVRIELTTIGPICVRNDSDGESIKITDEDLEAGDLGEAGRLEIVGPEIVDPALLSNAIGACVSHVRIGMNNLKIKSLYFKFNGQGVFFSNIGDTLNFSEDLFRRVTAEEGREPVTTISYPNTGTQPN